jgi:hypothetical protein
MRVLIDGNFISTVSCNLIRHAFTGDDYAQNIASAYR